MTHCLLRFACSSSSHRVPVTLLVVAALGLSTTTALADPDSDPWRRVRPRQSAAAPARPPLGESIAYDEVELGRVPAAATPRALAPPALPGPGPGPRPLDWDPADRLPYGGPLAGRTIVLSPGHGWIWDAGQNAYRLQRPLQRFTGCGSCRGVIEDLTNAAIVTEHLRPLLEGAGARVLTVREQDLTVNELIVDDQDAGYREEGPGWAAGNSGGGYDDSYRVFPAGGAGRASWALEPPAAGVWQLAVRWRSGGNRSSDAQFTIHCADGVTRYAVDQRQRDDRWVVLGRHFCAPGQGHFVELSHGPASDGVIVADAVRLGGGTDSGAHQPRWQMGALHYLPWLGPPVATALVGRNDVTSRPTFANLEQADLYLAVHTNSSNGGQSGTSTYRYSCGLYDDWSLAPPARQCDLPTGSARLQELLQATVVSQLRSDWDPAWVDDRARVANFGELRPLVEGVPGVLVELAYHDNLAPRAGLRMSDNQAIHDPRWRAAAARGLARAVVTFFAGAEAPLPPAAPTGLLVLPDRLTGSLLARWQPVAGALGYRVQLARGGRAFDGGTVVDEPRFVLEGAGAGVAWYLRVSALSDGGEGPPSEVGGARLAPNGAPVQGAVLIVDGFDRQDAWVQELDNRREFVVDHGEGIVGAGPWAFGSVANEALDSPELAELDVDVIDWLAGEESTEHETFDEAEQAWLETALAQGAAVLASGSEIGWDLDARGSAEDRDFLARVFGVALADDSAGTHSFTALADGPLGRLAAAGALAFDDGTHGSYDPGWPDVFATLDAAAEPALAYGAAGGQGTAAVAHLGPGGRTLICGFPVETVYPLATRAALLRSALQWLTAPGGVEGEGEGSGEGEGEGGGEGEGEGGGEGEGEGGGEGEGEGGGEGEGEGGGEGEGEGGGGPDGGTPLDGGYPDVGGIEGDLGAPDAALDGGPVDGGTPDADGGGASSDLGGDGADGSAGELDLASRPDQEAAVDLGVAPADGATAPADLAGAGGGDLGGRLQDNRGSADDGCGCRTPQARAPRWPALLLPLLGLIALRRRHNRITRS